MLCHNLILAIIALTFCGGPIQAAPGVTGPQHNKTVVCYVSTWAVYRPEKGSFNIDNFDPNLCTLAIYAFAGLDVQNDAIKSLDAWQDLETDYGLAGFKRLTSYKNTHKHLKVLLAIGGWNEGSKNYSDLAGDFTRRMRFVKQASEFVRKHNFDGLDLDWEYPTQREGLPQDKETFVLLVKELSQEFRKYNLYLSSAFGASKKIIDSAYNIKALAPYLDSLHIMCYDYFGAWDKKIGFNAPLESQDNAETEEIRNLNVKFSIEYFIKLGAPKEKIMLGLPFYGRTFITKNKGDHGEESDETGFAGPYTREAGFNGYNEICKSLANPEWKSEWNVRSSEALARAQMSNGTHVVTYDSPRSIANKVRYAIREGLGGVMVWSIDTDDFNGECDDSINFDTFSDFRPKPKVKLNIPKRTGKNYPLLRTLNEAIEITLDEMTQENNLDISNEIPSGGGDGDSEGNQGGSQSNKPSRGTNIISSFVALSFLPLLSLFS